MNEPIYEVFARKKREDALHHIGVLNAPNDELARVFAWKTYDEQNWFEMYIVRRAAFLPVNREVPPNRGRQSANADEERIVHARGAGSYGGEEVASEDPLPLEAGQ